MAKDKQGNNLANVGVPVTGAICIVPYSEDNVITRLLGGSAGTWAGMYAFRHKTKHWYFVKGMPLIFFIHVVIACVVYRNFY